MKTDENNIYLGDGAYARFEGYAVTIYASNGIEISDSVVLEKDMIERLMRFLTERGWKLEMYNI